MQLQSILTPGRTFFRAPGNSKKRALENTANFICQDISSMDDFELFDHLIARERLGSTGLGNGIAIPHCRVKNCQTITGTLIKLEQPIDFDAIDGQPVDLLFVLLVPEEANDEHLQALAMLAEKFSDPDYCQRLRDAKNSEELYAAAISK
jgi:PTS system nitrogen regulatory IIA component